MNRTVLTAAFALLITAAHADAQVIYSNIPATPAGNYASQPYQAQQTAEFGNLLHLGAGGRDLSQVSFLMSTWAIGSTYPLLQAQNAAGWTHDFTLNIYNVGPSNTVGSLISSTTQNSLIAWRPEASPSCSGTRWYSAADNACYNGMSTRLDFNFAAGSIIVPNDVIVALAFNTNTWGANPMGQPGPYESLNVAAGPSSTTAGSENAGVAYRNYYTNGNYTGLIEETDWSPYAPMMEVTAVVATPEPASMVLLATGLLGIAGVRVRQRRKSS